MGTGVGKIKVAQTTQATGLHRSPHTPYLNVGGLVAGLGRAKKKSLLAHAPWTTQRNIEIRGAGLNEVTVQSRRQATFFSPTPESRPSLSKTKPIKTNAVAAGTAETAAAVANLT